MSTSVAPLSSSAGSRLTSLPKPDAGGHFDRFGGRFVPEALYAALDQLEAEYRKAMEDPGFAAELGELHASYTGRPSPITEVPRFAAHAGGARIVLKREDLNHTGSHKINNVLGQALLTKRMGKTRVIAETGAGQHGVATATAAALFGLECRVYMGKVDTERQALNVARMQLLGAEVIAVDSGTMTLKDAMNEAMRDWVASVDNTHYLIGTVAGPHPFPELVAEFQRIISTEARAQLLDRYGRLPDAVAACIGGGSNALGIFADFIPDRTVELFGFEAGGDGMETGRHAAAITAGEIGVLHGMRTYVLQDADGQTKDSHSISAGLDYPGVGPEHAWLADAGRAHYEAVTDAEAMDAFGLLCKTEGIIPAIESAHALAGALRLGPRLVAQFAETGEDRQPLILVSLSGRGDKDVATAMSWFDIDGTADNEADRGGDSVAAAEEAAATTVGEQGNLMNLGHTGQLFADLRQQGRGGLVGYLPVGYPSVKGSLAAFRALTGDGDSPGVDLVEIGLPYSDPVMDGKTIQKAGTRALQRGVRTADVFAAVETVTATETAAVVMIYWNLVERYGPDAFARDLAAAGGAGLVTPDLTPDEAEAWFEASQAHDLDRIFLVSPSSTDERLARTLDACRGWVYATAVMGVTGARAQASSAAPELVGRVRAHDPSAMAGVGLGVSNGAQAAEVNRFADAAIVGSALVQTLVDADEAGRPDDLSALRAVVADLAAGVRTGTAGPAATLTGSGGRSA